MEQAFTYVFVFFLLGAVFSIALLTVSLLLRSRRDDPRKNPVYECGMEAVGTPWVSPNIRFYAFALLFVVFDVEALFLFPWAVTLRDLGLTAFIEMLIFLTVLFAGLIYAWRKGLLRWE